MDAKADIDPRTFLIDVERGDSQEPIEVEVNYVACDDAETFCLPVTQRYRLKWQRDAQGGSRPTVFMPKIFANVSDFDVDRDGRITKKELPKGRVTLYIGHFDANFDEVIDEDEIDTFLKMFNNGAVLIPRRMMANDLLAEDKRFGCCGYYCSWQN